LRSERAQRLDDRTHIDSRHDAASVTILAIGYRAPCTARGCRNLARTILRYADRGGRPLANLERCNAHTRVAIERDIKALTIYDNRELVGRFTT